MSGPHTFDGTAGRALTDYSSDFKLLLGTDDLNLDGAGRLRRTGGTSSAILYGTGDNGATTHTVKADLLFASNIGIMAFASVSAGAIQGYFLGAQSGLTSVRLSRMVNGAKQPLKTPTGLANTAGMELRASINASGNVVLDIYKDGAKIDTYTDSDPGKYTTGQRGIAVTATGSMSPALDNYSDNYVAALPFILTEPSAGDVFEGIVHVPLVEIAVAWPGSPTSVEARLVDASGNALSGFDWSTKIASPAAASAGILSFINPPIGLSYTVQVRDGGNTSARVNGINTFGVGAVVPYVGRSQPRRLRTSTGDVITAAAPAVSVQYLSVDGSNGTAQIAQLSGGQGGLAGGIVAFANQWAEDRPGVPLKLVDCSFPGLTIVQFNADVSVQNGTGEAFAWPVRTGYVDRLLAACQYRVSLVLWITADVANSSINPVWSANADQYADWLDGKLGATTHVIVPFMRAQNGDDTWALRQIIYNKATSGGRWRLGAWACDIQNASNGDPHQAIGPTGNQRLGRRCGRSIARYLGGTALDIAGPKIVSAVRAGDGSYVDLTFDRDIETPFGATTGLPGWFISATGSSWPVLANATGAIIADRVVRLTPTSGAIPAGARFDYMRGVPWSSDPVSSAYVGPEADMEAGYLSKVVVDRTSFDGGRGMPVSPIMSTGMAIAEAAPLAYTTIALGTTITLTKAQAATLRIKDNGERAAGAGAEPVSLRWERKTGDRTGVPYDGINARVTVA